MTGLRAAISGANGRMGRMLVEAVLAADDFSLTGALEHASSTALGRDAGDFIGQQTGIVLTSDIDAGLADAGFLIDFTRPEGTLANLAACVRHGVGAVIGTTGFDATGRARIEEAADRIPIVFAPNMSVGVNATFKLLEVAARILADDYDVEIIEAHHRHKVDAPSGTALRMGEVIAAALGRDLDGVGVFERHGITGERDSKTIGFATIRGGDIVGDHTALFAGVGERIEITHRSSSRMTYAHGALRACRFLAGRRNGLFDMQDVLGLRTPAAGRGDG